MRGRGSAGPRATEELGAQQGGGTRPRKHAPTGRPGPRTPLLLLALFSSLLFSVSQAQAGAEGNTRAGQINRIVRESLAAGRWFPGTGPELKSMVNRFIEDARTPQMEGRIVGAVAAHAGYRYSGKAAGYTFRAIRDNALAGYRPETVVVLGLRHRGGFSGVALVDGDAFRTPLGATEMDRKAGDFLTAQSRRIFYDYRPHLGEHSAENEIPFIQCALPGAKLVIGLVGDHDPETIQELAAALDKLGREKEILVIASSDMMHHPDYERVTRTDRATLEKVKAMDYASIREDWTHDKQIFCGVGPVLTVMRYAALQGCKKGRVLYYCNSGDDFPESRGRWVVGYGSIVFAAPPE